MIINPKNYEHNMFVEWLIQSCNQLHHYIKFIPCEIDNLIIIENGAVVGTTIDEGFKWFNREEDNTIDPSISTITSSPISLKDLQLADEADHTNKKDILTQDELDSKTKLYTRLKNDPNKRAAPCGKRNITEYEVLY